MDLLLIGCAQEVRIDLQYLILHLTLEWRSPEGHEQVLLSNCAHYWRRKDLLDPALVSNFTPDYLLNSIYF